jgi:hypothetical protein
MEERELTVEDLLDPDTLLLYVADFFLGKSLNLNPLLDLRDFCMPLVQYDRWWSKIAETLEKFETAQRELYHLNVNYVYCFEEPRYPENTCKRLRRRLETHVRGARKLLARVEELIKEGESLEVRRRNFEHLMGRLSWMRNNLSRVIEETQKLLAKDEAKGAEGGLAEGVPAQG